MRFEGALTPHQGGAGSRGGRPVRGGPETEWGRGNEAAACRMGQIFAWGRSV